jgi:tetratricopeptide (TPR) repeat protein
MSKLFIKIQKPAVSLSIQFKSYYRQTMNKIFLLLVLFSAPTLAQDQPLLPGASSQFISFWKSHVLTAQQDARVALADDVFKRLLRGWDSSRLEPALYVVDSDAGPWAASLVDGNILLSARALDAIDSFGPQRARHLLAFVLAHELAHQRADDLWQHRFFRQRKHKSDDAQQVLLATQAFDQRALEDMEQKEQRADHDGLILMASVGFNPYQVVGSKDFFTEWVENIWQQPCDSQPDTRQADACQQAQQRALRSLAQLDAVASQSSLYDLGVQALVANKPKRARHYFTQFGRDFPNRAVLSALGLSYLSEAIALRKTLLQQGQLDEPDLFYPLLLDNASGFDVIAKPTHAKRGINDAATQKKLQQVKALVERAVEYFDKAIRLDPQHRNSYLLLANAYLLVRNSYMLRGVLQGQYIPRFGQDRAATLMLALADAIEGKTDQAIASLQQLVNTVSNAPTVLPDDLLKFSISRNLAALFIADGQNKQADEAWKTLAKRAQLAGKAYLFRLALAQIRPQSVSPPARLKQAPTINGLRLGNRKTRDDSAHSINELWIEGEQFHVYNYRNGAQFITGADGRIIAARQHGDNARLGELLKAGDRADRPLKALGLPDRRVQLVAGEYLAYDQYGLALHIDDGRVQDWFLY